MRSVRSVPLRAPPTAGAGSPLFSQGGGARCWLMIGGTELSHTNIVLSPALWSDLASPVGTAFTKHSTLLIESTRSRIPSSDDFLPFTQPLMLLAALSAMHEAQPEYIARILDINEKPMEPGIPPTPFWKYRAPPLWIQLRLGQSGSLSVFSGIK